MKREFAEQYGNLEQWHWWFRGRQRILDRVLRRELNGVTSPWLASVGCGPAEGLAWLCPMVEPDGQVVGLDLDASHARNLGPRLKYVVGRLEAVPLASRSFDAVLALDVLEHLDDDAAGLHEAARLVKPAGLLLVTVPAFPSLWGGQDEVSHHRRRYTKQSLNQAFARARLPSPEVTYFNALLLAPIAMIRWMHRIQGRVHQSRSDFDGSRPGLANEILAGLFAAERHLVGRVPIPAGVSLLATARP
jgi:SAM-dependent methyltransferase